MMILHGKAKRGIVQQPPQQIELAVSHDNIGSEHCDSPASPPDSPSHHRMESSIEVETAPDSNLIRPKKRARTELSRPAMSYPRKRAVTACQLCRARKTKCSNTRPKCTFCTDSGAECIYEDPLGHSSFDPASLVILERLNQVLERLDNPPINYPTQVDQQQNLAPLVEGSAVSYSPYNHESNRGSEMNEEHLRIPASRTTCDKVLSWPIFNGRYPPHYITQSLFEPSLGSEYEDGSKRRLANTKPSDRVGSGQGTSSLPVEENALRLVENFITVVHTKNPILEIQTLRTYARRVAEDGPRWDGESCLVLLACALGSLAKPFSESLFEATNRAGEDSYDSLTSAQRDLQIAEYYYGLARKRIGLLSGSIIRSQCYLLSGIYLMYTFQQLEAWQNFTQASSAYYIYLQGRFNRSEHEDSQVRRTRRLEQRLYWTCFKSECELRVELSFPESSIADLQYPDMFPSPPAEEVDIDDVSIILSPSQSNQNSSFSPTDSRTTKQSSEGTMIGDIQQQSWYYYLTEIALRRIGNRILNVLYKDENIPGFGIPVAQLLTIAVDFEDQLLQWQETLPEALYYDRENLANLPSKELTFMLRGRTIDLKCWLYSPFLYYAIHHPADNPYQQLIQPFVEKCFEYAEAQIRALSIRHRHHGIWLALRVATMMAFSIVAAVKYGYTKVPVSWRETIELHISNLCYWEKESPDIAKARFILQQVLNELS